MAESNFDRFDRIIELAEALRDDIGVTPATFSDRIDQLGKHGVWLHEIQEATLQAIEANHQTSDVLLRLGASDV